MAAAVLGTTHIMVTARLERVVPGVEAAVLAVVVAEQEVLTGVAATQMTMGVVVLDGLHLVLVVMVKEGNVFQMVV